MRNYKCVITVFLPDSIEFVEERFFATWVEANDWGRDRIANEVNHDWDVLRSVNETSSSLTGEQS